MPVNIRKTLAGYVDSGKITAAEIPIFEIAAERDSAGVFELLDKLPPRAAGNLLNRPRRKFKPSDHSSVEWHNITSRYNGDAHKVYDAVMDNWHELYAAARHADRVKNENTFSSALTTNVLILAAVTQSSPKFAAVNMFARSASPDPMKPLATGQMKFVTTVQDGSTTQTNATNFQTGDSSATNVQIPVSQYTESFHLTNDQYESGLRLQDLAAGKLGSLGSKITKAICANITAANYSIQAPVISGPGAFGFSNTQTLWGNLKKASTKNLLLDGPYLAKLTNVPTLYQPTPVIPGVAWKNLIGWDYLALCTEWSAAGNNIVGFACAPEALGVIAGVPFDDFPNIPGQIITKTTGILPGVELPIAAYGWFDLPSRTYWASFDMMLGASPMDTTIGNVIASGTPT